MRCSTPQQRLLSLAAALFLSFPAIGAIEEKGQLPLGELRTFADVYHQIRVGYVEDIDDSELL